MLFINWLHLDWVNICAWIFGILGAIYVSVRIKKRFHRWSRIPPHLDGLPEIGVEISQSGRTNIFKLKRKEGQPATGHVTIWTSGRCPRFLINLAWGLSLHLEQVRVYELSRREQEWEIVETGQESLQILFSRVNLDSLNSTRDQAPRQVLFLSPPAGALGKIHLEKNPRYLISGSPLESGVAARLERDGVIIVKLGGGKKFRGYELSLFGEVMRILQTPGGERA